MNKYKIVYWLKGDILVAEVEGESKRAASFNFYMNNIAEDIISINEVEE